MPNSTGCTLPQDNTKIKNLDFLTGIMGEYALAAHVTGFLESPADLPKLGLHHYWGGTAWYRNPIEYAAHNNFFVISTFHQSDDGKHRRRKESFAAGWCMMLDDIGTGPGSKIDPIEMLTYPQPSWKIETSPDNWQWGYIFDSPVMDKGKIEAILKGFVKLGLVDGGGDPGMLGATRYARLPVGANTKAAYGGDFRHVLTEWYPDRRYSIDELAKDFGISLLEHYPEEGSYGTAPDPDNDPVFQSLKRLNMIKAVNHPGIYDIVCPWIHNHTELLDNGSAYLAPTGYRCHHGSCESKTGRDLLGYLHGKDPIYKAHCAALLPFQPVSDPMPSVLPDQPVASHTQPAITMSELTAEFDIQFNAMLQLVDPNHPPSSDKIYYLLAEHFMKFSPMQQNLYINLIKGKMGCTLKVARDQMKHIRTELLREHRKNGILEEPAWKDLEGDKILGTVDNFRAMCEYHGITMRYNQMDHTINIDIPGQEYEHENIDNLNLTHMRDMVSRYNMNFARCAEWIDSMGFESPYHPFRDYLDKVKSLPFDPLCPAFAKLMTTLDIDLFPEQAEIFIRRWLISIVAAVRGHGGSGMKGCLTLTGKQDMGKTSWLRNLFQEGMFHEGMVLDPANKDSVMLATNALVCELGELDATFAKKDIAAIKAFLSNQTDRIRAPYAAKISTAPRRTVFCASVNESSFLVDQTGNSRFWPIAVNRCDFMAVKQMHATGEIDNLWREIDAMYEAAMAGMEDFRWWISAADGNMLNEVSEEFTRESVGEGMLRDAFDMDAPLVDKLTTPEIMVACGLTLDNYAFGQRKAEITAALKRITGQHKRMSFRRGTETFKGFKVPPRTGALGKAKGKLVAVAMPFEAEFEWL